MDDLFQLLSGRRAARDIAPDDWAALLAAAETHQVGPLLAQRVLSGAVPDDVRATLAALQAATAHWNMRRLRDFAAAATALEARGIPVIALKGTHLSSLVYHSLAARAMVDIDLLVPAESLVPAGDALVAIGYAPCAPYVVNAGAVPSASHQLPAFRKEDATTVEVHWHLCDPGTAPRINIAELWERAMPARIGGLATRVLAAEDLLLHLATHATYTDRCDISARACCDIAEIVRTQQISWPAVIERSRRWNVAAGTYLVLRLARDVFATPIPDEVLAALEPPDFDERILRIAMRGPVARNVAAPLRYSAGFRGKLRALKELLLPDLDVLASRYQTDRKSKRIYLVPFLRALKLPGRWRDVAAVIRNDQDVAESAIIQAFLRGTPR